MLVIKSLIHKILVRIANKKDHDQTSLDEFRSVYALFFNAFLSSNFFFEILNLCFKPVILFGILGSYLFLYIWENILIKLGK